MKIDVQVVKTHFIELTEEDVKVLTSVLDMAKEHMIKMPSSSYQKELEFLTELERDIGIYKPSGWNRLQDSGF